MQDPSQREFNSLAIWRPGLSILTYNSQVSHVFIFNGRSTFGVYNLSLQILKKNYRGDLVCNLETANARNAGSTDQKILRR